MQRKWLGKLETAVLMGASLFVQGAVAQAQDEPVEESWTDMLSISAFVDANVSVSSQKSGTSTPFSVTDGAANHRAYVMNNGFALNFAGLDASINGEQFGATISLRYGPSVIGYFGDNSAFGFANLTQAYATWMPHDKITFDFGQFATIYGAEVADSWQNMNYTRGALYWGMQPFWHTGLRAGFQLNDTFGLTALVVNGTNDILEYSKGPSLGLQASMALEHLELYLGYFGDTDPTTSYNTDGGRTTSPLHSANSLFNHFIDLTGSASVGDFSVVFNGDVGITANKDVDTSVYYGISVAPGYSFNDWLGVAARVEYLGYPDGGNSSVASTAGPSYKGLTTLTGTVDIKPVPNKANVILRPEFRYELASDDVYIDRDGSPTDGWWLLTLGAVVTTDG